MSCLVVEQTLLGATKLGPLLLLLLDLGSVALDLTGASKTTVDLTHL